MLDADDIGAANNWPYEYVELKLVSKATELWSVIEVAQYAHLLLHDEPETADDANALHAFMEALNRWIEGWDAAAASLNKAPVLQEIDACLRTLADFSLFVHWGCVERDLQAAEGEGCAIPVAIVTIDRNDALIARVAVPKEVEVSSKGLDADD